MRTTSRVISFLFPIGLMLNACGGAADEPKIEEPTAVPVTADEKAAAAPVATDPSDSLGRPLGAITKSIVQQNNAAQRDLKLVARVEVQPNEILEFYEPQPGVLMVSGAGAPEGPAKFTEKTVAKLRAIDVWKLASNDAPVPPALADAIKRNDEFVWPDDKKPPPRTPASGSGGGSSEGPRKQPQASTLKSGGWCDTWYYWNGYGDCSGDYYDWNVCLDNWWNGAYAWDDESAEFYGNVCPADGNGVTYQITSDEGFGGYWSVATDTLRWYSWTGSPCIALLWDDCPYIRADVGNATNDRFHFRHRVLHELF